MAHYKPYDKNHRAQRRIQGEDVFGKKIQVILPNVRTYTGREMKNGHSSAQHGYTMPPPGFAPLDYGYNCFNQPIVRDSRKQDQGFEGNERSMRPIRGAGGTSATSGVMDVDDTPSAIGVGAVRRSRTPQSLSNKSVSSPDFNEQSKTAYSNTEDARANLPVDLVITSLDPSLEIKQLKLLLNQMFKDYCMILNLNVVVQADGNPIAHIRVNSPQEAQFAISQLHRQRLGNKRIIISYAHTESADPVQLRAIVFELLQEVPNKRMPLFKFIELLESRYHCTVSVSEINKLKDVCKITEEQGSRIISLNTGVKTSPPPNLSRTIVPYCTDHCPNGFESLGWGEHSSIQIPTIMMSLKVFSAKLQKLLDIHWGSMPLLSFQYCYEQEFHEPLPVDDKGVPLEHLISCIPEVELKSVGPNKNIKIIKQEAKVVDVDSEAALKTLPASLAASISLLCRELVDLLKTTERCQLPLSRFIPAYHHHFGRQCRVSSYGHTKLIDLLESIPHVVQIVGDSSRRILTLSHTAQVRRFTTDLLRVLKVQPAKQLAVQDFAQAYEKVTGRIFSPVDYGLCTFEDLICSVPENTVVLSRSETASGDVYISMPKREQTSEEVARTKQFKTEVVDLLKHVPYFSILFNKFVPAYHHHFGHQCKVSDYGFTKLIDLFEAIPDIVKISEQLDGERIVSLTLNESLKVLSSELVALIRKTQSKSMLLDDLGEVYLREYGYPFSPEFYECATQEQVIEMFPERVQMVRGGAGTLLTALEMDSPPTLTLRSWALLLKAPHFKDFYLFEYEYQSRYNSTFSINDLRQLDNVVSITSKNETTYIALTALYVLAARLYHALFARGGIAPFAQLERIFYEEYGEPACLAEHGVDTPCDFIGLFSDIFYVRGAGKKRGGSAGVTVAIKRSLADYLVPLPESMYKSSQVAKPEAVQWPAPPYYELLQNKKKPTPPKPDTPSTPGLAPWNHWTTSPLFGNTLKLSIPMPIVHNPKLLGNPEALISPARHLLPSNGKPWLPEAVASPPPTSVPMPDKLTSKIMDISKDSGCNTRLENSKEVDSSDEQASFHLL